MSIVYAVNERVLCYHGPLIYEAKVLKADNWDQETTKSGVSGPHYFVHYKGWKQTWDEWVPAQRLLKLTEENIQMQKSLHQQASASAASGAGSSSKNKPGVNKDGSSARAGVAGRKDGTRGTKRGREEDEGNKKPEMRLNVPEVLKVQLVDDWENVTKNNQLVPVPRSLTVDEVLEQFGDYARTSGKNNLRDPDILVPTIIQGLIVYFDKSLGATLLYRFERPQYAEMRKQFVTGQKVIIGEEREPSAIYGAEHLLRMLVSLPQMVASSTMDGESVTLVRDYVNELLSWMVKEKDRIFVKEYESASLQYQNISRS